MRNVFFSTVCNPDFLRMFPNSKDPFLVGEVAMVAMESVVLFQVKLGAYSY